MPSRLKHHAAALSGLAAAVALLGAGRPGERAQGPLVRADSACATVTPSGTARVVAAVSLVPADSTQRLPPTFVPYVLDALQQHYKVPAKIDIPVIGEQFLNGDDGRPPFDDDGNVRLPARVLPNLYVHAYFTLHGDRAPSDIAIGGGSLSPALETSVVNAIAALTPDELGPLPDGVRDVRMNLIVEAREAHFPYPPALFITDLPVYTLERAPGRAGQQVVFPKSATNAIVDDSLVVRYVVDEQGRVPMNSVEFLSGRYREFSQAILAWLPKAHFTPARAGGCPVAMVYTEWHAFHNHVSIH